LLVRRPVLDDVILVLGIAELTHAFHEAVVVARISLTWRAGQKPDAPDLRRLLRDRRERPRYRRTANDTDEFPSPHCFTRAEDYVGDVKYHISHLGTVPRAKLRRTPGDVRFGSKADISGCPSNVRFTPKSGHRIAPQRMSAMCQKQTLSHTRLMSGRTSQLGPVCAHKKFDVKGWGAFLS